MRRLKPQKSGLRQMQKYRLSNQSLWYPCESRDKSVILSVYSDTVVQGLIISLWCNPEQWFGIRFGVSVWVLKLIRVGKVWVQGGVKPISGRIREFKLFKKIFGIVLRGFGNGDNLVVFWKLFVNYSNKAEILSNRVVFKQVCLRLNEITAESSWLTVDGVGRSEIGYSVGQRLEVVPTSVASSVVDYSL